jgi:2,5-diketo-D-gluconate reductase B
LGLLSLAALKRNQLFIDPMNIQIDGARVPSLGFGTWPLAGETCTRAVKSALSIGYRHVDTAQMYNNETEVGLGLRQSGVERQDLFLTTKILSENLSPIDVRRSTEESLRKLRTDYVDLLLIHWPYDLVPLEQSLEAMFELQREGKTRHVGVSNFPTALLRRAVKVGRIFCNQVEYHPFLSQRAVLEMCRQENILLTAYSPLAHGKVQTDPTLQKIAEKYGKLPSQVALRWLVQQPNVAAIPKAAAPEHQRSNLAVFDFELNEEEMNLIFALDRNERLINPHPGPEWDQ